MDTKQLEQIAYVSWEEPKIKGEMKPAGCSLYLNKDQGKTFLREYQNTVENQSPKVDSNPVGEPLNAGAGPDLYKRIQESENGLRLLEKEERILVKKRELVYGSKQSGWVHF